MFNVLVLEDDKNIRRLTEIKLKNEGYNVYAVENGKQGLEVIGEKHIDIIIADVMMDEMDGYEFISTIRELNITTPCIMVTARGSLQDKTQGFNLGVDDYMVKPIDFDELFMRMKAVLRRAKIVSEKKLIVGETTLDYETLTIYNREHKVTLSKREFSILYKLLSYSEKSFSKSVIFEEFWDYDSDTEEDSVKVYINRIRNKIACFKEIDIETIRGLGYRGVKNEQKV
ncbi:MAG: response regulator transcription factor [Clostridia bacterium]|nr:response regulator transcription factor [Clostridia bacterium]